MKDIQIFNNDEFGDVRVIINDAEEPMFCLPDVCRALGLSNASQVKTRLKDHGVIINEVIDSLGRKQQASFISESNLYKCIFMSRAEHAEHFQDWVCDEVLPSIRKTGGYMMVREDDTEQEIMSRALLIAQDTLRRRDERIKALEKENTSQKAMISEQQSAIEMMEPKVTYCDIILKSPSTVTVTQIAPDYGKSARAFNKILAEMGIQHKVAGQWILYAENIAKGYVQSST